MGHLDTPGLVLDDEVARKDAESLGDGLQALVAGHELPACRSAADAGRRAAKRPLLTRSTRVNALDRRRLLAGRWRRLEARRAHDWLY